MKKEEINKLCLDCKKKCKQFCWWKIHCCKNYEFNNKQKDENEVS